MFSNWAWSALVHRYTPVRYLAPSDRALLGLPASDTWRSRAFRSRLGPVPGIASTRPGGSPGGRVACGSERDRLAARWRPCHLLAGATRPDGGSGRRGGGRAGPGGGRRLGCASARSRGSRRAVGWRRVLPGVLGRRWAGAALDGHDAYTADSVDPRA